MHLLLLVLQQLLGVLTGSTAEPAPVPAADAPPAGEPHRGVSKFVPLLGRPTPPSFACAALCAAVVSWFGPPAERISSARTVPAGRYAPGVVRVRREMAPARER